MDKDPRGKMETLKPFGDKSSINDILILVPEGKEFPKSIGFKNEQDGEMFAKYMKTKYSSEPVPLNMFQMECFDWSKANKKQVYIIFGEPSEDAVIYSFYQNRDNLTEQ